MKAKGLLTASKAIAGVGLLAACCAVALALLSPGTEAPDFNLKSVDGRSVSFSSDLKGKVVLLRFFATWHEACADEVPNLNRLDETYKDRGLKVVAIATDSVNGSTVARFVKEHGAKYMVLLKDKDQKVLDDYNVRPIPCGYVIDKTGRIQLGKLGPLTGDTLTEFEEKIKSLL
jgi:peroxiredoxin